MFKNLRARLGIISSSRLPLYVQSLAAREDAVRFERVRFRRPVLRPKAMVAGTISFVTCYSLFSHVVLSPLEKFEEDFEKNLDEQTKKEIEEETLFIPFPGTTKQLKPRPYRGSDPEWQEYIKFTKDQALGKRVRDDLARIIKDTCEKSPSVIMRCGNNVNLRRYWLDVDFPLVPPPEFERSGIEIANDYITWTTMPVESSTVSRLQQALWPSALALSIWTFYKSLLTRDSSTPAERFGGHQKPGATVGEMYEHIKHTYGFGKPDQSSKDGPSPTTTAASTIRESKQTDSNHSVSKSSTNPLDSLGKPNDKIRPPELDSATGEKKPDIHVLKAAMAAQTKFAQIWRAAPHYPPRGSIIISGLIELDAPNAWLVLDVKAAWDPKTKTFDMESIQVGLRRLQMKKQAPLGGR